MVPLPSGRFALQLLAHRRYDRQVAVESRVISEDDMRITREQARKNQGQMIKAAADLFREHGFDGVGVVDLMKGAGFTHGGFYNHFESKDDLMGAAAGSAFRQLEEFRATKDLHTVLSNYLSAAHRAARRRGCPASALSGDAARQPDRIKRIFADGIEGMIGEYMNLLEGTLRPAERRDLAINMLATAVGALVLARAIPSNDELSQEILDVNLRACLKSAQGTAASRVDGRSTRKPSQTPRGGKAASRKAEA
jgi:TetR/AcrR family transcriptional repressor of nem operon